MTEIWKLIPDECYEVSSLGRVRSPSGRILAPRKHTNGYQRVSLGAGRDRYVHRLVCLAFFGPPPSGNHADHINGSRDDNRAENLRWVTPEENRACRKVRQGSAHGNSKLTEQLVRDIRAGKIDGTNRQIAHALSVSRETVRDVRNGKLWRHVS